MKNLFFKHPPPKLIILQIPSFVNPNGKKRAEIVDPIEKKPLYMFHLGKRILSIGSFGCNLRCPFCQNFEISPEQIAVLAKKTVSDGNIGVAYTYNEPLSGYEFVCGCTRFVREAGLCNVLVTNGYINREPFEALLPFIAAVKPRKNIKKKFLPGIWGRIN
ncbi:MAG: radical SAM protein [Oscillospiraceae bacterium]|nr:radical SAM protein [Oscillospiraceae bacterium]